MAIFRKRDGDTPPAGATASGGAQPGDEAASNGVSAPDEDRVGGMTKSGLPRGKFFYVTEGYGPLPDED